MNVHTNHIGLGFKATSWSKVHKLHVTSSINENILRFDITAAHYTKFSKLINQRNQQLQTSPRLLHFYMSGALPAMQQGQSIEKVSRVEQYGGHACGWLGFKRHFQYNEAMLCFEKYSLLKGWYQWESLNYYVLGNMCDSENLGITIYYQIKEKPKIWWTYNATNKLFKQKSVIQLWHFSMIIYIAFTDECSQENGQNERQQ